MTMDLQYAYLVGDTFFAAVWLALYIGRRDIRREMILTSSLVGVIAFLAAPLFADYWHPVYITF